MSNQYESEWLSFISNTEYPFVKLLGFPFNIILDITITAQSSLFMSKFESAPAGLSITFSSLTEDIAIATCDAAAGDYPIVSSTDPSVVLGYIRLGEAANMYANNFFTKIFSSSDAELLDSCIFFQESIESINDISAQEIVLEEGYNMRIDSEMPADALLALNTTLVSFVPSLGGGKGIYCGKNTFLDAIFNINSVDPDDKGVLAWEHSGFFSIREDPDNHTIEMSLTIPEARLLCTRNGFLGAKGWTGPFGPDGPDGKDAPEVSIEYGFCENIYRGKV